MPKRKNRYSGTQVGRGTRVHTHTHTCTGEMCVHACTRTLRGRERRKGEREREKWKEKQSRKEQEPFLVTLIVTFNLRKESKSTPFSAFTAHYAPRTSAEWRMEEPLQGAMVSHWHPVQVQESGSIALWLQLNPSN